MGSFTNPSVTRTYTLVSQSLNANYCTVQLAILDANGVQLEVRNIQIPIAGGAIADGLGNTIAATVPTALANAINSFMTSLQSAIDTAAASGKFNR
jgi:hypothetical protein